MAEARLSIAEQARKIEEDCERAAIRDALISARWYRWNLWLGLTSTIAAAIAGLLAGSASDLLQLAGAQAAQDKSGMVALFALASAVLASILTFLSPSEKANAFQQTSNKYHSLRERLRFFRYTKCADNGSCPEEELEKMIAEKQEIDTDHPIVPEWSYERAHQKIKEKIKRNDELSELRRKREPQI